MVWNLTSSYLTERSLFIRRKAMDRKVRAIIMITAVWLWMTVMLTVVQYGSFVLTSANDYTVKVADWLLELIFG